MFKKINKSALIFAGALALANPIYAQNIDQTHRQGIESIVENEFNIVRHTMRENETIRNLEDSLRTENYDKIQWLMDTYNTPLSRGDRVTVVEAQTESGIYYPVALEVDYFDPEQDNLLLIGEPSTQTSPFAFIADYYDTTGDLRRRLWINNERNNVFDILNFDFRFPLEGYVEDHFVTSRFGIRENPTPNAGGPNQNNHLGTDWRSSIGTELYAPFDGRLVAGYSRRDNYEIFGYNTDLWLGKFANLSARRVRRTTEGYRRAVTENITFQFYHLNDFEEELKDEMIEGLIDLRTNWIDEFREWYHWIASEINEERILENLRHHNIETVSIGSADVDRGDMIAYTGNTGLSSGPHIHVGVVVNGRYVDPEEFFRLYGIRRGYTPEEMQPKIEWYRNLIE